MKITLESTSRIVQIQTEAGQVPAGIWEGATDKGIPVVAMITRIAVARSDDASAFERELDEARAPSPAAQAFPIRLVL
jgi:hypothetical protein